MSSKRIDVVLAVATALAVMAVAMTRSVILRGRTRHTAEATKRRGGTKSKRVRAALCLVTLGAVASASVGVTMALYSNKPTGETNTFVAGTVSVTNVVTGACLATTANMAPADTASCTMATTYGGSLSGYMALDVFIATQKSTTAGGAGATDLYNPADSTNEVQITVNSTTPTVSYIAANTNFGTAITCPNAGASLDGNSYTTYDKCYLVSNMVVSASVFTNATGAVTFTTAVTLPSTQPNTYQGSSAVVVLAAHAVQSKNNTINCTVGGATPTAGAVCLPAGSFAWS